jgi:hypothetical protein
MGKCGSGIAWHCMGIVGLCKVHAVQRGLSNMGIRGNRKRTVVYRNECRYFWIWTLL